VLDVDQTLLKDSTSYIITLKVTNFLQQRADSQVTITKVGREGHRCSLKPVTKIVESTWRLFNTTALNYTVTL
jgi:6-phosphogluconolactonase/glucosamine-6-phosphate isomerase/deaminase